MSIEASKPIIRWCIGGFASKFGYDCLRSSIINIDNLYGHTFDKFLLFNDCNAEQIKKISTFDVELVDQSRYSTNVQISPMWKLIPPRLDVSRYEIFIDNDIILYNKLPLIDEFLSSNFCFMTEGARRRYGKYDSAVPAWYKLNSGLFGLPPSFDLESQINIYSDGYDNINHSWFDEQGLVAAILSRQRNFKMIDINDITICENEFIHGNFGAHFVGLNNNNLKAWKQYET